MNRSRVFRVSRAKAWVGSVLGDELSDYTPEQLEELTGIIEEIMSHTRDQGVEESLGTEEEEVTQDPETEDLQSAQE